VRESLSGDSSALVDAKHLADKESEISRLVDAIARIGYSESLEVRLRAAERERNDLRVAAQAKPATWPSPDAVSNAYRRFVMDLKSCLEGDVTRARAALQQFLGEVRVIAEGDEVSAEVETRADRVLLDAVGAGVSNWGCGGRI
jgi:hypothetical protein